MSAAYAGAAAAILFSKDPSLTPAQVKAALIESANPYPSLSGRTVTGGVLDVGQAMEIISPTVENIGDFNSDGCVDGSDFLFWQRNFGLSVPAGTGADASGNGIVDSAD